MDEQKLLLFFSVAALAATLGLYFFKAFKQVRYKGDERWRLIQLKANNAANLANWVLIVILFVMQITVDLTDTVPLQRMVTCGLLYIGARNLIELCATFIYDKTL